MWSFVMNQEKQILNSFLFQDDFSLRTKTKGRNRSHLKETKVILLVNTLPHNRIYIYIYNFQYEQERESNIPWDKFNAKVTITISSISQCALLLATDYTSYNNFFYIRKFIVRVYSLEAVEFNYLKKDTQIVMPYSHT